MKLMVGQGLPEAAEEWLETAFPGGDWMYSFLQCINNNPFDLNSDSPDSDSGNESGNDSEQGQEEDEESQRAPTTERPERRRDPEGGELVGSIVQCNERRE